MDLPGRTFSDMDGHPQPFLTTNEVAALSIRRGSLSDKERREIESHVTHTFKFLSQIPWTGEYREVPIIAYAHHEKMDGTGYPRKLKAADIPIQSRMMTISDIFDALVAWDRPYKKSVPVERGPRHPGRRVEARQARPGPARRLRGGQGLRTHPPPRRGRGRGGPLIPLVIAHRGDSAHRPENTLASFQSALEVGAALVEFDVQLTRDGHVVVIHDPTVDRTTNGRGRVAEMSLVELRALSAGYPERFGTSYAGERIPTLAEVLSFLRGRVRAMVEIKTDSVSDDALGGIEARTIEEVRRQGMSGDLALVSFDTRALRRCRDLAPEIVRGHLFAQGLEQAVAACLEVGAQVMMPEKRLLSEEARDRARSAGLKLATWVVDDPDELEALRRFELYGLATNRPGVMLEALADGGDGATGSSRSRPG